MRSLMAVVAAALVVLPAAPAWAAGSPPVPVDDAVTYRNEGGQLQFVNALANDSDPDGDPLTYTAVTPATKGEPSIWDGKLYYRPNGDATGTDTFTYTVSDGHGNTASANVSVTLWVDAGAPRNAAISIPTPGSVTLTWLPGDRAVEYRIRRNGVVLGSTTGLTWTDSGLLDTEQYEYFIVPVDAAGVAGHPSYNLNRLSVLPTPRDITVDLTGDPTSLQVDWAPWDTFGPWRIYRDGVPVGTSASSSFRDTGLVTGRAYSYQVQLLDRGATTEVWPPSALSGPVTATPAELSPINRFFWDLGWTTGRLGPITVPERSIPGGRQQDHRSGLILQRDGATPFAVFNPLATAYIDDGGATGDLGFPVGAQENGLRDGGFGQLFEGGSIWGSSATPTTVVYALIEDGWATNGWEDGPLGYPVDDLVELDGGFGQEFEDGVVFWSQATGSRAVADPMIDRYAATGASDGPLGYPTRDTACGLRGGGCWQAFQSGDIHWSPTTGAHITSGAFLTAWSRAGAQNGALGYPTRDAACGLKGGGCWQGFQGGYIHWSPATGAQVTTGAFAAAWARAGAQNGTLGYPVTGATCGLRAGGCLQRFQGGYIHSSPTTGAQVTTGAMLTAWSRAGAQNGRLGYPTSGASRSGGSTRQSFQGGVITIDTAGRVRITYR